MSDDDKQVVAKPNNTVVMSPYSLFSSDNPGAMITSVQLKGDNYNEWATEVVNALRSKKKIGFVDGSLPKPDENHKDLEAWLSVNSMIVGWIRTSIEPRLRSTVTFITDAHKLWENLKKRFDYYGLMAVMWEELQTYRPPPACMCSAATHMKRSARMKEFISSLWDWMIQGLGML